MKNFEQINEGFISIQENKFPLEQRKKEYNFFFKKLEEKIKETKKEFPNRNLSLENYIIDHNTTFQDFDTKVDNIIGFIKLHFLQE